MIFVKGYGQMCNNILQYAHLYAFGREYGIWVVSMRFAYKYRYFKLCQRWYHHLPMYLLGKLLIKTHLIECVTTDNTSEVVDRLKTAPVIASQAWGGCRFPDLFMKYRDEIKDLFTIRPSICQKVQVWMNRHPKADICLGLHIRRGDYATWEGGKYFFSDDVYIERIREFKALFPESNINVYICTNDRNLDIDKFKAVHTDTFLSRGSGIEDLRLLSQCDYIVGARSTFSMVAAFYNDLPIYWIMDKDQPLKLDSFKRFKDLYMTI